MKQLACFAERSKEPVPGKIGPAAGRYLDVLRMEGHQEGTLYEYQRELFWLASKYPELEPAEFTPEDIEDYLLIRCVGRSKATRKKVLVILRGFFKHLHDRGRIPRNPCAPLRTPRLDEPDPSYWNPEEIGMILRAPATPRDHLLVEMFARTGQRMESIQNLTWDRIDLEAKNPTITFPGKGGKVHELDIHRELLHDLLVYKRMTNPGPTDHVFLSNQRRIMSHQTINRVIEKVCRAAGVRVKTAHEFRRSAITNLLQAGVPLDVVSKDIANHASVQTTMRHYRGAKRDRQREALKALPY